ncbi:MAG: DNA translocase FtsK, partial [Candidatus Dormibacteraeota bacterium]|nr:DNA translocase FtsK [Candidatus Dormibacteraeota bacterium]
MARSATARKRPARRSVPAKRGRISPQRRRAPKHPRTPLLSPEQRREITGVATIGVGVLVAAVLILPGGGAVAGPAHDWLYGALGVGAWLAVAALVMTGVRLTASSEWRAGGVAATGSMLAGLTLLGLVGLAAPDSAGALGRVIGPGLAGWLGRAGAAALLLAAAVIGAVLATELRVGPLLHAVGEWFQARQEERADARLLEEVRFQSLPPPAKIDAAAPRALTAPPVAELAGVPLLRGPRSKLEPPSAPVAFPSALPPDEPAPAPDEVEPFSREFEGVAEPAPGLGPVPEVTAGHAGEAAGEEPEKVWVLPPVDLLDTITGKHERLAAEVRVTGDKIVSTLQSFGIETRIIGANSGPTVTQYELQPAVGVPVRKIIGYQTDLALALAAPIRIQPFIPGKSAIGIEVPNKAAQLVSLKEIVESGPFGEKRTRLAVALGADVSGHPVVGDLTRMPHMLIAGATGSGKSVCINALLGGFLLQTT